MIKKEEAKKYLINIFYTLGNLSVEYLTEKHGEKMRDAISVLEQEPKTGHWIHHKEKMFDCAEHWECSRCHRTTMTYPFRVDGNDYDAMYYCPKCGAKMIESEDIDCGCIDAEIAKSFIEDAEAVKDLLPQAESEKCSNIVKETNNQIEYVINQQYSPVDFCNYGKCPICGETVSGFSIGNPNLYDEECPKCGQKLKWR